MRLTKIFMAIFAPDERLPSSATLVQVVLPHPIPLNLTYVIALKLAKSTLPPLSLNTKLEMVSCAHRILERVERVLYAVGVKSLCGRSSTKNLQQGCYMSETCVCTVQRQTRGDFY